MMMAISPKSSGFFGVHASPSCPSTPFLLSLAERTAVPKSASKTTSDDSLQPAASFAPLWKRKPFWSGLCLLVLASGLVFADYWVAMPDGVQATFIGRSSCVECHQKEFEAFTGSDHDKAMDLATEDTVLGDFNDVIFEHDGLQNRLFRDGDLFLVNTEGPDGEMHDYEVKYVFGVYPLQQYMVEFDRSDDQPDCEVARLQVLRISWDSKDNRWFYLRPPDVTDKLAADDPLHWTGIAQRWQTMCADCHSTNLKTNFNTQTQSYHTTFSEIDVSCEACHGPASLHVELARKKSLFWDRRYGYGLTKLKGESNEPQIQTCAPCHSRRSLLDTEFAGGATFHDHLRLSNLDEQTYHGDGQILDEVYVYGSFIQSKMYHKGIRCSDCHDPHSLKLKHDGNNVCTSCHQHAAGKYDVPSHHFHAPGTAGAQCVNCHMPHTTYMEVDPRRDHSLRVPRPDLSVQLGVPNACSHCHVKDRLPEITPQHSQSLQDKEYSLWLRDARENPDQVVGKDGQTLEQLIQATDKWCDDACEKWYGEKRFRQPHFAEALVPLRNGQREGVRKAIEFLNKKDFESPAIARATLLDQLAAMGLRQIDVLATTIVEDGQEHPIVRAAAARALARANPQKTYDVLTKLLSDKDRLVRLGAAQSILQSGVLAQLTKLDRMKFDRVLKELKQEYSVPADRAGAHLSWGSVQEQLGFLEQQRNQTPPTDNRFFKEAIESYRTAIEIEPKTTGARSNLAFLLENMAQSLPANQQQKLMAETKRLRSEELPLIARDAKLAPNLAILQYRYGLALYTDGQWELALEQLKKAAELDPQNPDYQSVLMQLKQKLDQRDSQPPQ